VGRFPVAPALRRSLLFRSEGWTKAYAAVNRAPLAAFAQNCLIARQGAAWRLASGTAAAGRRTTGGISTLMSDAFLKIEPTNAPDRYVLRVT
jgi:hypothetical protein